MTTPNPAAPPPPPPPLPLPGPPPLPPLPPVAPVLLVVVVTICPWAPPPPPPPPPLAEGTLAPFVPEAPAVAPPVPAAAAPSPTSVPTPPSAPVLPAPPPPPPPPVPADIVPTPPVPPAVVELVVPAAPPTVRVLDASAARAAVGQDRRGEAQNKTGRGHAKPGCKAGGRPEDASKAPRLSRPTDAADRKLGRRWQEIHASPFPSLDVEAREELPVVPDAPAPVAESAPPGPALEPSRVPLVARRAAARRPDMPERSVATEVGAGRVAEDPRARSPGNAGARVAAMLSRDAVAGVFTGRSRSTDSNAHPQSSPSPVDRR